MDNLTPFRKILQNQKGPAWVVMDFDGTILNGDSVNGRSNTLEFEGTRSILEKYFGAFKAYDSSKQSYSIYEVEECYFFYQEFFKLKSDQQKNIKQEIKSLVQRSKMDKLFFESIKKAIELFSSHQVEVKILSLSPQFILEPLIDLLAIKQTNIIDPYTYSEFMPFDNLFKQKVLKKYFNQQKTHTSILAGFGDSLVFDVPFMRWIFETFGHKSFLISKDVKKVLAQGKEEFLHILDFSLEE